MAGNTNATLEGSVLACCRGGERRRGGEEKRRMHRAAWRTRFGGSRGEAEKRLSPRPPSTGKKGSTGAGREGPIPSREDVFWKFKGSGDSFSSAETFSISRDHSPASQTSQHGVQASARPQATTRATPGQRRGSSSAADAHARSASPRAAVQPGGRSRGRGSRRGLDVQIGVHVRLTSGRRQGRRGQECRSSPPLVILHLFDQGWAVSVLWISAPAPPGRRVRLVEVRQMGKVFAVHGR